MTDAPWNLEPSNLHLHLKAVERRLTAVEAVLLPKEAAPLSTEAPTPPSYPPQGTLPRALSRLLNLKRDVRMLKREFQLLCDFILKKFPFAKEELEQILRAPPLSPSSDEVARESGLGGSIPASSARGSSAPAAEGRPTCDSDGDEIE